METRSPPQSPSKASAVLRKMLTGVAEPDHHRPRPPFVPQQKSRQSFQEEKVQFHIQQQRQQDHDKLRYSLQPQENEHEQPLQPQQQQQQQQQSNIYNSPRAARKAGLQMPVVGWQGKVKAQTSALENKHQNSPLDSQNASDLVSVPYSSTQANLPPPQPYYNNNNPTDSNNYDYNYSNNNSNIRNGVDAYMNSPQTPTKQQRQQNNYFASSAQSSPSTSPGKENHAPKVKASAFQTPPKQQSPNVPDWRPNGDRPSPGDHDRYAFVAAPLPKSDSGMFPIEQGSGLSQFDDAPNMSGSGSGYASSMVSTPGPTPPTKFNGSPSSPFRGKFDSNGNNGNGSENNTNLTHHRANSSPQASIPDRPTAPSSHAMPSPERQSPHHNRMSMYQSNQYNPDYNQHNYNHSPARSSGLYVQYPPTGGDAPDPSIKPLVYDDTFSRKNNKSPVKQQQQQPLYKPSFDSSLEASRPNSSTSSKDTNNSSSLEKRFSDLMDSMQIPMSIRQKMLDLEPSVKEGMLANPPALSAFLPAQMPSKTSSAKMRTKGKHTPKSKSSSSFFTMPRKANSSSSSNSNNPNHIDKKTVEKLAKKDKDSQSPTSMAALLHSKRLHTISEEDCKFLRTVLRTAGVGWLQEWITFGGYEGLLDRLGEVLSVEWREEQHDDKVLHELLRCVKALLLSQVGREALASKSPTPFRELSQLLYSEKKPGDLACRQVIIEIFLGLFDVFPKSNTPVIDQSEWKKPLDCSVTSVYTTPSDDYTMSPQQQQQSEQWTNFEFVKSLVLGPPDEKEDAEPDFLKEMRRKRLFKRWVKELEGVCMDYFWVFCHSKNKFWRLQDIDENDLDAPKVPGGMTGGVENEAMQYCRIHLKLINTLVNSSPSRHACKQLHSDLFESGFERIVVTLRKASTEYYPGVHLELARYVASVLNSGCDIPPVVARYIQNYRHV